MVGGYVACTDHTCALSSLFILYHIVTNLSGSVMVINFANIMKREKGGVIGCERSVITVILHRLDYLVYCLGNYADDNPTKTDFTFDNQTV